MAKKNNSNNRKTVMNHSFKGVRDTLLVPQPGGLTNTALAVTSTNAGTGNNAWTFSPLGLTSVTLAGGVFSQGTTGNIVGPSLRSLYNRSLDFQWYRVTRAKVVFVGNVGSTVTGSLTMAAYTDPSDVGQITYQAFISGPGTRSFDMASAATKEFSVPVPVDSSWKRVSSILTVPGNVYPYTAAAADCFSVVNSVADLCFGAFTYYLTGYTSGGVATASNVGQFYLDYDVEFKSPVDVSVSK